MEIYDGILRDVRNYPKRSTVCCHTQSYDAGLLRRYAPEAFKEDTLAGYFHMKDNVTITILTEVTE